MITMAAIMRITATTDPPMMAAVERDADENKKDIITKLGRMTQTRANT